MTDDLSHNLVETRDVEITMVGGGAAGAYATWHLLQTEARPGQLQDLVARNLDKKLCVAVSEYSGRIRGRLYSLQLAGTPRLPIELGGMRFLNTHERVMSPNSLAGPRATTTHSVCIPKFSTHDGSSDRIP